MSDVPYKPESFVTTGQLFMIRVEKFRHEAIGSPELATPVPVCIDTMGGEKTAKDDYPFTCGKRAIERSNIYEDGILWHPVEQQARMNAIRGACSSNERGNLFSKFTDQLWYVESL